MNRVPLPPGFNDLARELEVHRRSLSPRPPGRDRYPFCVQVVVLVAGVLIGVVVALATDQAVTRAAFDDGVTVEAVVTGVDHGEPMVRFTTDQGVEVTTTARGEHTLDDPSERLVLHLPDAPERAVTADHRWPWWPWLVPVALLVASFAVLWHRGGVRAGYFRRRVRVLRWGPPEQSPPWRHALPWTASAALLVATGVGFYLLPLLANTYVPSELFGVGAALVVYGLALAVQALYRHAEHAPVDRAPRIFRPLSSGVVAVPGLVLFVAAFLVPLLSIALSAVTPDGHREHGIAAIVDYDCRGGAGYCVYSVTVEYEAGELTYRDTIVARPRDRAEQLVRAAQAPVSWSSDDPTDLRGEW